MMIHLKNYINQVGLDFKLQPLKKSLLNQLPNYLHSNYQWYELKLLGQSFIIAHTETDDDFTITAIDNQLSKIENNLGQPIILSVDEIEAYNRKRLIEKKRAFIVPYKQMYIPFLLIDLSEYKYQTKVRSSERLQPFAQVLVIAHLLNKDQQYQFEGKPFKKIAQQFQVNTIKISRAVENLAELNLIEIRQQGRYKMFSFTTDKKQLWVNCLERDLFFNPISKQYYTENKFNWNYDLLKAGDSALANYTNINPSEPRVFAVDNTTFKLIKKNNETNLFNKYDGRYNLQVWKYAPEFINTIKPSEYTYDNVDPISLYLTYKGDQDERVQMELENLIKKQIW